jgi:phosphoglycolate phosphatase
MASNRFIYKILEAVLIRTGVTPSHCRDALGRFERVLGQEPTEPLAQFADLATLFEELRRRGLLVGVVSNDTHSSVMQNFRQLGLLASIDFLRGYQQGLPGKPDPYHVLSFCNEFGIRPSEVAFVGDSEVDMETAFRAGAGARIGVLSGAGDRRSLARAHQVLPSVDYLVQFLEEARLVLA